MTFFEASLPAKPYPLGYTSGYFDLFHVGHLRFLQLAAQHCEKLIVGIPSDSIVRADNRPPPTISCQQRIEIIASLRCVDEVICIEVSMEQSDAFAQFMCQLGNQAIFIGEDWQASARWQRLGPKLQEQGVKVHFLPRTDGISSTLIKQKLAHA